MKNYETPKLKVVSFETEDIIQTSGLTEGGNTKVPGTGVIVPIPPSTPTSLDEDY